MTKAEQFLEAKGIHPHKLTRDCSNKHLVICGLLEEFSNQENAELLEKNKEQFEILKDFVNAEKGLFSYVKYPPKERLKIAEQLLKSREHQNKG